MGMRPPKAPPYPPPRAGEAPKHVQGFSRLLDVLIDFDGTVAPFKWPGLPEPPYPGVRDAMIAMKERGYMVVIFTARAWKGWIAEKGEAFYYKQLQEVFDYCKMYDLPVDEVTNEKRPSVMLIDDSSSNPFKEGGPEVFWWQLAKQLYAGKEI